MPVVLSSEEAKRWIDTNNDIDHLQSLIKQYPESLTDMIEVSTKVNKAINDDPSLIEEHQDYSLF